MEEVFIRPAFWALVWTGLRKQKTFSRWKLLSKVFSAKNERLNPQPPSLPSGALMSKLCHNSSIPRPPLQLPQPSQLCHSTSGPSPTGWHSWAQGLLLFLSSQSITASCPPRDRRLWRRMGQRGKSIKTSDKSKASDESRLVQVNLDQFDEFYPMQNKMLVWHLSQFFSHLHRVFLFAFSCGSWQRGTDRVRSSDTWNLNLLKNMRESVNSWKPWFTGTFNFMELPRTTDCLACAMLRPQADRALMFYTPSPPAWACVQRSDRLCHLLITGASRLCQAHPATDNRQPHL